MIPYGKVLTKSTIFQSLKKSANKEAGLQIRELTWT